MCVISVQMVTDVMPTDHTTWGVVYRVNKSGPKARTLGDTIIRLERFPKFIQKFNPLHSIY